MRDAFSSYHPAVNFLYFTLVLLCCMFFMHPACLVISLLCAVIYSILLTGRKAVRFQLCFMLPLLLVTAVINPVFNHEGATILTYMRSGNPLTLESILYGIAAAVMLISVVTWFSCFNKVMTSDKFVYLFGRIIPGLSLVLSMVLRFVPKFKEQFRVVQAAQKCVGRDLTNGGLFRKIRNAVKILSIMVTWSLENAIETADSMKSRGYGLHGRTAFSIYRMDRRDGIALCYLVVTGGYVLLGACVGGLWFRYFPTVRFSGSGLFSVSLYLSYFLLCILPVVLQIVEEIQWKRIESNI